MRGRRDRQRSAGTLGGNAMALVFESRATGSVWMTEAVARTVLEALGHGSEDDQHAQEGIFTVEQLPALIGLLEALIARSKNESQHERDAALRRGEEDRDPLLIGMHQRVWPLLEQFRRALAAEKPVTWRKG